MTTRLLKKTAGQCVFCKRAGNLTKQHILPARLRRFVSPEIQSHDQYLTRYCPVTLALESEPVEKKRQGHLGERKLRRVCARCNNGWVREAEERAVLLLQPVIEHRNWKFHEEKQLSIALMLGSIAVVADLDDPGYSAISPEESTYIFERRQMPQHWRAFVGKCSAEDWRFRWRHVGGSVQRKSTPEAEWKNNVMTLTVGIGSLALHVISLPEWYDSIDSNDYGKVFGLASIWPSNGEIDCSDVPILDNRAMLGLSDAYANFLAKSHSQEKSAVVHQ